MEDFGAMNLLSRKAKKVQAVVDKLDGKKPEKKFLWGWSSHNEGFHISKEWHDGPFWSICIYKFSCVYSRYGLPYIFQPKE